MNNKVKINNKKQSFLRRFLNNLYPFFMIFSAIAIITFISLILYSKTEHFQQWANSLVNESLESTLQPGTEFKFKSVSISYLIGLKIDGLKLIRNNEVFFSADEVHAGVKFLPLFRDKIVVNEFLINKPEIFISRSKIDSIWNVEKLFLPSKDTIPSEPMEMTIDLNRIRITNGKISVFDSTKAFYKNSKFDFEHFTLMDFNLNLSSDIDLKNNKYNLNVKKLKFTELNSNFKLNALRLIVEIDTTKIDIKNFSYNTDDSDLEMEAVASNINIFDENRNLDSLKTVFSIKSNSMDLYEISKFISDINLHGKTKFNISGNGNYISISLKSDDLVLNNSNFKFKFNIKNPLSDSPKLSMFMYYSRIYEKDVLSVLAEYQDIDLPNFDFVFIKSSVISFKNNEINAEFDVRSPVVYADGFLNLNLNNNYSYRTSLNIKNLNLAPILKNPELYSKINANLTFEGEGNNFENLIFDLRLKSHKSRFTDLNFKDIKAHLKIVDAGNLEIDTLNIQMESNKNIASSHSNLISTKGLLNFKDLTNPSYNLVFNIEDFSPENILSDSLLPETISTNIAVSGRGMDPDNISGSITADYFRWKMNEKTMSDLAFSLMIDSGFGGIRTIRFNSKPIKLNLTGKYKFNSMIALLRNSVQTIQTQVNNKINVITLQTDKKLNDNFNYIKIPDPIEINLSLKLFDSLLVKELLQFKQFKSDLNIDFSLKYDSLKTEFNLTNIIFKQLFLNDGDKIISINNGKLKGHFNIKSFADKDSLTEFETKLELIDGVKFNDFIVNSLITQELYKNDSIFITAESKLLNNIDLKYSSSFAFLKDKITMKITNLFLNYNDIIKLFNPKDLNISINSEKLKIRNFDLDGNIFGKISLTGIVNHEGFDNLNFKLKDFKFKELYSLVKNIDKEYLDLLTGKIDSIDITLNNSFKNTFINTVTSISGISLNGNSLGKIYSEFQHKDTTLSGFINSYVENGETTRNIFSFNIGKAPINLSFDNQSERFNKNAPISFSLNSNDFPLDYISPFINAIKNLKGFADISLKVNGENLESIDYSGYLNLKKLNYLLEFNNMKYYTNAKINFTKDSILIDNLSVTNDYYDLKNGKLITNGYISFDGFDIENFDLRLNSKQFKVLSNASMKSMPSLYGDFVIALNPIRIYGSPKEPFVKGEVNILSASLNMPSTNKKEVAKSKLIYKYKDKKRVDFEIVKDSIEKDEITENIAQKRSMDLVNSLSIDVGIRFKGKFVTTMEIAGLGQLFAEIGTSNPEDIVRFVMNKNSTEPSIYGADILVKENSTLKLIKTFNTKGTISFPKGTVDNPSLNLLATYNGQRITSDQISYYVVNMHIRGTKNEPLISFTYSIDGQEAQGDSSKINEDAILLLTLGKTKSELNPASFSSGNSDFIGSTASSVASTMASSALTDFVQATGFIQSADIDIGNTVTSFDQARMRLSGEIQGIRWTLGGTVADFANNNEISIDVPLAVDLGVDWMNHFILQLTKASNTNQTSTTRSQKDWEIKLKLGGSW